MQLQHGSHCQREWTLNEHVLRVLQRYCHSNINFHQRSLHSTH